MTALDARIMVLNNAVNKPLLNILYIKQVTDINMIGDGSFFLEYDEYLNKL